MKKAFTLIELVVVVLIIAIVIWTTSIRMDNFNSKKNVRQETVSIFNEINNYGRNVLRWKTWAINISWNQSQLSIKWQWINKIISWEYVFFSWENINTWFTLNKNIFSRWEIEIYNQKGSWIVATIELTWWAINEIKITRTGEFEQYNHAY